jgi:hypothetical protein
MPVRPNRVTRTGITEFGISHFSTSERKEFSTAFIACSRWFFSAQLPFPRCNIDRELFGYFA